ncbi:MAG: nitroreductase/quinone reductase family protein [Ilumatobacteraceae bacterium]
MSDTNDWNQQIIDEFRANDGKVGGMFEGMPMLILHSTGRKSGQERLNPLAYQQLDGAWAIFASKAGAPTHPDW